MTEGFSSPTAVEELLPHPDVVSAWATSLYNDHSCKMASLLPRPLSVGPAYTMYLMLLLCRPTER